MVFPLEIIPISHVFASLYHSVLSIFLLVLVAPFTHAGLSWMGLLTLPLLILPLALISLGMSWASPR